MTEFFEKTSHLGSLCYTRNTIIFHEGFGSYEETSYKRKVITMQHGVADNYVEAKTTRAIRDRTLQFGY